MKIILWCKNAKEISEKTDQNVAEKEKRVDREILEFINEILVERLKLKI